MLLDEILRTELGNSCACLMIVLQLFFHIEEHPGRYRLQMQSPQIFYDKNDLMIWCGVND